MQPVKKRKVNVKAESHTNLVDNEAAIGREGSEDKGGESNYSQLLLFFDFECTQDGNRVLNLCHPQREW